MGDRKKQYSVTATCFRRRMWFVMILEHSNSEHLKALLGARRQDQMIRPSHQTSSMAACGCPETLGRQFWLFLHDERKQPGWTGSHGRRCRTSSGESGTLPIGGGTQLRNEAENFSIGFFGFLTNASQFQVFPGVGNKLMAGVHHGSQSYDWTFRSSVQISAHTDHWSLFPRWPRYEGPEKKGT